MALHLKFIEDFVNKATVSRILFLIIMGTCILKSHSLPITPKSKPHSSLWWCQPCQHQHKTRHNRAINELVKDQFKLALSHFNNFVLPYQNEIHANISNINKTQLKNKWLRKKKFFAVLNYQLLKKSEKMILPKLLHQIKVYSIIFERLSHMNISSQVPFNEESRRRSLNQVRCDLEQLLFGIEHEMGENGIKVLKKEEKFEKELHNHIFKNIPEKVKHLSVGLIKDYSILENYQSFLKNVIHPLKKKPKQKKKNRNIKVIKL